MTAPMPHFDCYIDGAFCATECRAASLDPATGEAWATFSIASVADAQRAVEAADRAFRSGAWAGRTAGQRGRLLFAIADMLAARAGELAEIETRDTGKIIRETRSQIAYVAEYYRYFGGLADKIEGAHLPIDKPDMEVTLRHEPIGVVVAIVPWNSQLFLTAVKLAPALAAGCTVVLKASEEAPAPLLAFARVIHEAGVPAGVVNIISGYGAECGRALTSHPKVARVAFTGGHATARAIIRDTAANLAATSLELGGKSPILVFADAEFTSAVNAVVGGIFAASGQSCVACSRLLVERCMHERFLEALLARVRSIRIGLPLDSSTDMGPLATRRQIECIRRILEASLGAGARLLTGGGPPEALGDALSRGFFFAPTILSCDNTAVPCAREELFGPVLTVMPFDDEADAVAKANDTDYGLAAGLFTKDLARAHRVARALRAGVVWINTYRAISPLAPFGGFGLSGYGREGGQKSVFDYLRTKAVWITTGDSPIPDPFVMR